MANFAYIFLALGRGQSGWLLSLLLMGATGWAVAEDGAPLRLIQTAAEVRGLSSPEANRHYPVKLRGVVTFFDRAMFCHFLQDQTAGIYLQQTNLPLRLVPGQVVEVDGVTSAGEYAPVVTPRFIQVVGPGTFPVARPVSYEQLTSGEEDSQRVEVQGIVRAVTIDPATKYDVLEVAAGGGRFKAMIAPLPVGGRESLVDSTVLIRGVCASHFNLQRQLFDVRLLIAQPVDLTVQQAAQPEPFAIPTYSIEQLLQFTPHGPFGHRVKVRGGGELPARQRVVRARRAGGFVFGNHPAGGIAARRGGGGHRFSGQGGLHAHAAGCDFSAGGRGTAAGTGGGDGG